MNKEKESISLSEPFLSDHSQIKSRENEFYDCDNSHFGIIHSNNHSSNYQSFEQLPKSNNNVFKSFSDDKLTINSEKNAQVSQKGYAYNFKTVIEKKKKSMPLGSISDGEDYSKSSKHRSMNLERVHKSFVEIYQNNFEDPESKRKKSKRFEDSANTLFIETPRFDLTNRFINLISQSHFFKYIYTILTLMNISLRIYLMVYFYETYERGFELKSIYLCFFYIPRICYMLSMIKILFHVDVEEVYLERISVGFNSFDEAPVKSWNEQLTYDYELNMNRFFGRKTHIFGKWMKKPLIIEYKATLKAFFKRVLIVLIPVETAIIFFKIFYKEKAENRGSFIKIFLIANWLYQIYECLLIIPCILCLYFIEYKFNEFWTPGYNYDSLSFIVLFWEAFQFLLLNAVLLFFDFRTIAVGPFEFHKYIDYFNPEDY